MKPVNFIALVLFICGVIWVLTLSERSVRRIQQTYYATMTPFLKGGSSIKSQARNFLEEIEHSKASFNTE